MNKNQISDEVVKMVKDEASRICNLLKDIDEVPRTIVPLHEFETKFLPLLKNIGEDFNIQRWTEEVSHPFVWLQVYNTRGDIVYEIPPLLAQQRTVETANFRIVDQTDQIRSLQSDNPRAATNFIVNMLSNFKDKDFSGQESAIEMAVALNKVFADYNMPLLPVPKGSVVSDSVPSKIESQILDYDDF